MERPRTGRRADDVVAALHDHGRDVTDAPDVTQQLVVGLEEAAVLEVVCLDASERQRELVLFIVGDHGGVLDEFARRTLPAGPTLGRRHPNVAVRARQSAMVGRDHVVTLRGRDVRPVGLPQIGEDLGGAVLIEPRDLAPAQQEDAAQHELGDTLGMLLGVGQGQRAAPAATEHLPALELQMLAELLDVGDQIPRRVLRDLGVRRALTAAALIEDHDAVARRIEEPAHRGTLAAAGSAMQEHDRFAIRSPRLLIRDLVQRRDLEAARFVGLERRVGPRVWVLERSFHDGISLTSVGEQPAPAPCGHRGGWPPRQTTSTSRRASRSCASR